MSTQTINTQPPVQPPQIGDPQFDAKMRLYEAAQRDRDIAARIDQAAALRANEAASRELIRLAGGIPPTQASERRELALRILLAQPQVTGQTGLQAVDCAIQLADGFLTRFPVGQ